MKFIVGLGNPTLKYKNTRHNAGFILLDKILESKNLKLEKSPKLDCELVKDNDFVYVKPTTYMNNSGISVAKVLNYYDKVNFDHKIFDNLLVMHDDVDFDLGKFKLQRDINSAGHHGIESIINSLGSKNFWRFRIGVGRPENNNYDVLDWVLKKLSTPQIQEIKELPLVLEEVFK